MSPTRTRNTLGLIGGMSWHSTLTYYRIINEMVAGTAGAHASAALTLQSLDFSEIRDLQITGQWDRAADVLGRAAQRCVSDGADAVAICTNLMHKVAPQIESRIDVPLLHIGDAVGHAARAAGWGCVGVLGTRWVMEEAFYAERLAGHGIEVIVPDEDDRHRIDDVIFEELTQGRILDGSRAEYLRIIDSFAAAGAEAVVLACTEIGLLIDDKSSSLPVVDSAEVHARELGRFAAAAPAP